MKRVAIPCIAEYVGFLKKGNDLVPLSEDRYVTIAVFAETAEEAISKLQLPSEWDSVTGDEIVPGSRRVSTCAKGLISDELIKETTDRMDEIIFPEKMQVLAGSIRIDPMNEPENEKVLDD